MSTAQCLRSAEQPRHCDRVIKSANRNFRRRAPLQRQRNSGSCRPASASSASSGNADVAQLKRQLLLAVSRCNNPQASDNLLQLEEQLEHLAEQLARVNPTPDPALSPQLQGSWALLFSGRSRRLAAARDWPSSTGSLSLQQALQAASDSLYSLFYAYVPVLAGSAVGRKGPAASNTQILSQGRVDNVVQSSRGLQLRLCVSGTVEAVKPATEGSPTSCVAVRFDRFTAKVGPLPEAAASLAWLRPLGYVDTLYLDEELRISCGDKGGLFVLRRSQQA